MSEVLKAALVSNANLAKSRSAAAGSHLRTTRRKPAKRPVRPVSKRHRESAIRLRP
jgi:hypothetical protein